MEKTVKANGKKNRITITEKITLISSDKAFPLYRKYGLPVIFFVTRHF